jgi:hypothetical protein
VSEPKYVAETLAWCNARRKERGKRPLKKLPKGQPMDGESCPCGTATGLFVESQIAYDRDPDLEHKFGEYDLPRAVRSFVAAFDKGRLPQYAETFSAHEQYEAKS